MSFFRLTVIAQNATYSLASSAVSTVEGNQCIITLSTTGVQNGQQIPFTISGVDITPGDFVGLSSLGGFFVVQNGSAQVTLTTSADYQYEVNETFTVKLDDNDTTVNVDIINAMPGVIWDGGAAVWDAGTVYWDTI